MAAEKRESDFDAYQRMIRKPDLPDTDRGEKITMAALGLCGGAGKAALLLCAADSKLRGLVDDVKDSALRLAAFAAKNTYVKTELAPERRQELAVELGNQLAAITAIADALDMPLSNIARGDLVKRRQR